MATESLETQIQSIRKRVAQAQKEQVAVEHLYQSAKDSADRAKERLKVEFGVETTEEARAKLTELELVLAEQIAEVKKALAKLEG